MKNYIISLLFFSLSLSLCNGLLYAQNSGLRPDVGQNSSYFNRFAREIAAKAHLAKEEVSFLWRYSVQKYYYRQVMSKADAERAAQIMKKAGLTFVALAVIVASIFGIKKFYENGNTPLHVAAQKNDIKNATSLIEKGADVNASNNGGDTPLHIATLNGYQDMVKFLITKGALVNASNKNDYTPLHVAALNGYKDIVNLLITYGADRNKPNNNGNTPAYLAAYNGYKDVFALLIPNKVTLTDDNYTKLLRRAIEMRNKDMAQWFIGLINNKDTLNKKDPSGRTLLHLAAMTNNKDIAGLLIENGANIDMPDNYGSTPLHWASRKNKDTVELLIAKGANVNMPNEDGNTPLHWAVSKKNKDIAELLIGKGAVVNKPDNYGDTPLNTAVFNKDNDMIVLLYEKKADFFKTNKKKVTPFYHLQQMIKDNKINDVRIKKIIEDLNPVKKNN